MKISVYVEDQQKLYRSIRFNSLGQISTILDMCISDLRDDLRRIDEVKADPNAQYAYVNNLLFGGNGYVFKLDIMERELGFVRSFLSADMYSEVEGAVKRINGLSSNAYFKFFQESRAKDWVTTCRDTIRIADEVRLKINRFLVDENPQFVKNE